MPIIDDAKIKIDAVVDGVRDVDRLKSEINSLKKDVVSLASEFEDATDITGEAAESLDEVRESASDAERAVDETLRRVSESREAFETLTAASDDTATSIDELTDEMDGIDATSISEFRDEIEGTERDTESLRRELSRLESDLPAAVTGLDALDDDQFDTAKALVNAINRAGRNRESVGGLSALADIDDQVLRSFADAMQDLATDDVAGVSDEIDDLNQAVDLTAKRSGVAASQLRTFKELLTDIDQQDVDLDDIFGRHLFTAGGDVVPDVPLSDIDPGEGPLSRFALGQLRAEPEFKTVGDVMGALDADLDEATPLPLDVDDRVSSHLLPSVKDIFDENVAKAARSRGITDAMDLLDADDKTLRELRADLDDTDPSAVDTDVLRSDVKKNLEQFFDEEVDSQTLANVGTFADEDILRKNLVRSAAQSFEGEPERRGAVRAQLRSVLSGQMDFDDALDFDADEAKHLKHTLDEPSGLAAITESGDVSELAEQNPGVDPRDLLLTRLQKILTQDILKASDIREISSEADHLDTEMDSVGLIRNKFRDMFLTELQSRSDLDIDDADEALQEAGGRDEDRVFDQLMEIVESFAHDDIKPTISDFINNFEANRPGQPEPDAPFQERLQAAFLAAESDTDIDDPLAELDRQKRVALKEKQESLFRLVDIADQIPEFADALGDLDAVDSPDDIIDKADVERIDELAEVLNENSDSIAAALDDIDQLIDDADLIDSREDLRADLMRSSTGVSEAARQIRGFTSLPDNDVRFGQAEALQVSKAISQINPATIGEGSIGQEAQPITQETFAVQLLSQFEDAETEATRDSLRNIFEAFERNKLGPQQSLFETQQFRESFVDRLSDSLKDSGLEGEIATSMAQEVSNRLLETFEADDEKTPSRIAELLTEDTEVITEAVAKGASTVDVGDERVEQTIKDVTEELRTGRTAAVERAVPGMQAALEATDLTIDDLREGNLETVADRVERARKRSQRDRLLRGNLPFVGKGGILTAVTRGTDAAATRFGDGDGISASGFKKLRRGVEDTTKSLDNLIPVLGATSLNLGPLNVGLQNIIRRFADLTAIIGPLIGAVGALAGALVTAGGALGGFVAAGAIEHFERMESSMAGVNSRAEAMEKFMQNLREVAIDAIAPLRNVQLGGDGATANQAFLDTVRGAVRLLRAAAEAGAAIVRMDVFADSVARISNALTSSQRGQITLVESLQLLTREILPVATDALVGVIQRLPEFIAGVARIGRRLGPELNVFFAKLADSLPLILSFGTLFLETTLMVTNAILTLTAAIADLEVEIFGLEIGATEVTASLGALVGIFFSLTTAGGILLRVLGALYKIFITLSASSLLGYLGSLASTMGTALTGAITGSTVAFGGLVAIVAVAVTLFADFFHFVSTGDSLLADHIKQLEFLEDAYRGVARAARDLLALIKQTLGLGPVDDLGFEQRGRGPDPRGRDPAPPDAQFTSSGGSRNGRIDRGVSAGGNVFGGLLSGGTRNGSNGGRGGPGPPAATVIINNNGVIGERDMSDLVRREIERFVQQQTGELL